ncbi:hypothetical protein ASN18_2349 [Candidatus Magnetominusculus xianensis]|uniref:Uncharacterized protein n=1 Tax=Candidatus Magnetominusculus xianensis TaxID=1748249 RepID=A0ABR5SD84_9BACT|nr:hypothetical protein ASN18_2349 [Candidatus Magnetominusculus xianensis]
MITLIAYILLIILMVIPHILFYSLIAAFLIKQINSINMIKPHMKTRLLFYGHLVVCILTYTILNYFIFIKSDMKVGKLEFRRLDLVYSYYFILIELLYFWTLYHHLSSIIKRHNTTYVLYWPFYIICFLIPISLYFIIVDIVFMITQYYHNIILFLVVMYKVLYSFGWQLIIIYLINKYKNSHHSVNLTLLIGTTLVLLVALSLLAKYNISLLLPNYFLTIDYKIVKATEMLLLFYLFIILKSIYSDKIKQYLSYISIIICNTIVISCYMPFIDRMKIDYNIICPSLLLDSVIISTMLYRFSANLLKKLVRFTQNT